MDEVALLVAGADDAPAFEHGAPVFVEHAAFADGQRVGVEIGGTPDSLIRLGCCRCRRNEDRVDGEVCCFGGGCGHLVDSVLRVAAAVAAAAEQRHSVPSNDGVAAVAEPADGALAVLLDEAGVGELVRGLVAAGVDRRRVLGGGGGGEGGSGSGAHGRKISLAGGCASF